jgi:uncharacterized membrane protein YccC
MHTSAASPRLSRNWTDALTPRGPAPLFAVRLGASVCLAFAGARQPFLGWDLAAIVCQPQLGASLRKGWFQMIGTVVNRFVK